MVWFPTAHDWHCNWPVQKASPGMCPCKWCTFWTPFVNKLLQTTCIFHLFLVQVASIDRVSFLLCWCLMADRPTVLNCKALSLLKTVNEQEVKCWYFAWCSPLHLFQWHLAFLLSVGQMTKSHIWNVFYEHENCKIFLIFKFSKVMQQHT